MSEEAKTSEQNGPAQTPVTQAAPIAPTLAHASRPPVRERRRGRGGGTRGGTRGGARRAGPREERARPEFEQKMLQVRRVARVVAGGRRFNFSVLVVIGNRNGAVGVGTGKAGDTALAIEKATKNAKKHLLRVKRTGNLSIPHPLEAKYSSARVMMLPAKNKGLIAGSAARAVLELAGITDVNAKIRSGSKNKLNIARATVAALSALKAPKVNTESRISNTEKA